METLVVQTLEGILLWSREMILLIYESRWLRGYHKRTDQVRYPASNFSPLFFFFFLSHFKKINKLSLLLVIFMNRYKLTLLLWVRYEEGFFFFFYLFMGLSCLMVFNFILFFTLQCGVQCFVCLSCDVCLLR